MFPCNTDNLATKNIKMEHEKCDVVDWTQAKYLNVEMDKKSNVMNVLRDKKRNSRYSLDDTSCPGW